MVHGYHRSTLHLSLPSDRGGIKLHVGSDQWQCQKHWKKRQNHSAGKVGQKLQKTQLPNKQSISQLTVHLNVMTLLATAQRSQAHPGRQGWGVGHQAWTGSRVS